MSARESMNPRPMSSSAESGAKVLRDKGKGDEEQWDAQAGRDAEREEDEEQDADAAALDPQLERAEGEGMVTEHAKISATDPGPELPDPDPEEPAYEDPEPDHGPGEPGWEVEAEAEAERD